MGLLRMLYITQRKSTQLYLAVSISASPHICLCHITVVSVSVLTIAVFVTVVVSSGAGESWSVEQDKNCRRRQETEVRPHEKDKTDKCNLICSAPECLPSSMSLDQYTCLSFTGRIGALPG